MLLRTVILHVDYPGPGVWNPELLSLEFGLGSNISVPEVVNVKSGRVQNGGKHKAGGVQKTHLLQSRLRSEMQRKTG